jgi:hypothetical protein
MVKVNVLVVVPPGFTTVTLALLRSDQGAGADALNWLPLT